MQALPGCPRGFRITGVPMPHGVHWPPRAVCGACVGGRRASYVQAGRAFPWEVPPPDEGVTGASPRCPVPAEAPQAGAPSACARELGSAAGEQYLYGWDSELQAAWRVPASGAKRRKANINKDTTKNIVEPQGASEGDHVRAVWPDGAEWIVVDLTVKQWRAMQEPTRARGHTHTRTDLVAFLDTRTHVPTYLCSIPRAGSGGGREEGGQKHHPRGLARRAQGGREVAHGAGQPHGVSRQVREVGHWEDARETARASHEQQV